MYDMWRRVFIFLSASLWATTVVPASASLASYDIVGSFWGGELGTVQFDVTITADFSSGLITDTNVGLVTHALTLRISAIADAGFSVIADGVSV